MPDQDQILLQTKLHRPHLTRDVIVRWRLIELLNQSIDHPLTLVCAPAGFGKTTLVCTWLDSAASGQGEKGSSLPSAWLSLDENDSDLIVFLRYFIAALHTIYDDVCEETLALLHAVRRPPLPILYATFSNELANLPGEVVIVLDDYHTIHGTKVHNLLNELILHWPKLLHLVLVSRISPSIPLDSMRAKRMVNEIRARDLRFTSQETATYLSHSQFALMIQNALPLLEERFDGWPAGLHLAALSMRTATSQESVLAAISSQNPNITGYLVDEVLTHQVPAIQTFLLKTSILDRFCASLCEAVVVQRDAAWNVRTCLDWIEHSELFIIPLDNRREWYRYHHLFQELLQQRLSAWITPEQVTNLHRKASSWFEDKRLYGEALHHALKAGDIDLAVHQMGVGLCDVINREDRPILDRWLSLLTDEVIQQQPGLLMIKAWALEYSWRLDLQAQVLRKIDEMLDSEAEASLQAGDLQILRGQVLAIKAQQAYFNNQTARVIDLCQQALALLPPSWKFVRGGAMMYLGMAMQASGQVLAAERLLLDEYAAYSEKTDIYTLFLLLSLCFIYLNTGQLEQAKQIAQLLVQGSKLESMVIQKSWGDWFLGLVHYQRNELEAAAQHFSQIAENRYTAQTTTYRDAVAGLALIHQIKGESSEAWQLLESIVQFDLEQGGSEDNRTRSLRARLMLLQGDLEGASRWVDTFTEQPPDQPLMWLEEPQVTRVRILVARAGDSDLQLAFETLDTLNEIAERTHNTRYMIEILALRSLVLDAQRKTSQADAVLYQAIDLAWLGGFIRVFVDLGKPMQAILLRLSSEGHRAEMIRRILAAFPLVDEMLVSNDSSFQSVSRPITSNTSLFEPLTPRELEVLSLLRGPMSIKEIALHLNISSETVKRHTANIYGKLGVNQRRNAVARAEELNILSPR
jgi:LuxR family maltose regulon positive regulatory protein